MVHRVMIEPEIKPIGINAGSRGWLEQMPANGICKGVGVKQLHVVVVAADGIGTNLYAVFAYTILVVAILRMVSNQRLGEAGLPHGNEVGHVGEKLRICIIQVSACAVIHMRRYI